MLSEEQMAEFDRLYEEANKGNQILGEFIDELIYIAKKLSLKHYPDIMNNLESEGYRRIEDRVVRHCVTLSRDVSQIVYECRINK